ncbi:uncharacterized protein LOC27206476 isoform X1 [Drosophila simulans]|uniref:uncharacterized protein LOC27206476 isoform X1 n=1 Tax=Drosophila simulans TaxID=7240 RepID=UPI00192CE832|nr:uncharacterized protein LOC27206476 isoform X1 [Drosophila simulans]
MTSPFDGVACLWLSLIWIQLGLINAGLEFLKDFVPLHLVRLREIEDEEREIQGECTLGAISIRPSNRTTCHDLLSLELSNRLFLPAICMRNYMDEAKALTAGSTSRSLRNLTESRDLNTVLEKNKNKNPANLHCRSEEGALTLELLDT